MRYTKAPSFPARPISQVFHRDRKSWEENPSLPGADRGSRIFLTPAGSKSRRRYSTDRGRSREEDRVAKSYERVGVYCAISLLFCLERTRLHFSLFALCNLIHISDVGEDAKNNGNRLLPFSLSLSLSLFVVRIPRRTFLSSVIHFAIIF